MRRRGIWSEAETELCSREIRRGMKVLDIGANLGYFTLLFARAVGPDGQPVAVAPAPPPEDPRKRRLPLIDWLLD